MHETSALTAKTGRLQKSRQLALFAAGILHGSGPVKAMTKPALAPRLPNSNFPIIFTLTFFANVPVNWSGPAVVLPGLIDWVVLATMASPERRFA